MRKSNAVTSVYLSTGVSLVPCTFQRVGISGLRSLPRDGVGIPGPGSLPGVYVQGNGYVRGSGYIQGMVRCPLPPDTGPGRYPPPLLVVATTRMVGKQAVRILLEYFSSFQLIMQETIHTIAYAIAIVG